jgi:hypothetical protein
MANTVLFAQTFNSGGINYEVTSATAPLTEQVGSNSSFVGAAVIPETVTNNGNTYTVTAIGIQAFNENSNLTSVMIPNSVITISDTAFRDCTGLTSVTIPNSVTSLGFQSFRGCTGLISVAIGNSVTTIGNNAFRDCTGLTSVTIGNSVTSIGSSAFRNCTSLTSVTIGNSVTSLENFAFRDCTGLTSVNVNWTSPVTIAADVFQNVATANVTLNNPEGTLASCQASSRVARFYIDRASHIAPNHINGRILQPNDARHQ